MKLRRRNELRVYVKDDEKIAITKMAYPEGVEYAPVNPVTGNRFKGMNAIGFMAEATDRGYEESACRSTACLREQTRLRLPERL
jgi:hypothetical protein